MKHLGISGGGTKIAGLFGVCESIIKEKGYKPDIISGISAGALLSVPLALGKLDEIKKLVLNLKFDTFFNESPVKKNGKIRVFNAIRKIISGKHYLGKQRNLEKTLSELVSKDEFEDYKKDITLATCVVGSVDFYSGKRFYINLKNVSYENFLKYVNASASLPIYTPGISFSNPIKDFEGKTSGFDKVLLYDGGVRDHSPSNKILASNHFQIKETCTIFSRPENFKDIINPNDFKPRNLMKVLERYVEITTAEVSKNDKTLESEIIKAKSIFDHGTFYLPKVMNGVYDINKDRLKELYEKSKERVNDITWKKL